jgi:hypothetical protein
MSPRKALLLLVCLLGFSLATGCSDACIQLANQICDCQPDTNSESNCQQLAQASESVFPVRSQDQTFCQHQLDTNACDCNKLSTPEGRQGCGLSFAPPDAGTDAGP